LIQFSLCSKGNSQVSTGKEPKGNTLVGKDTLASSTSVRYLRQTIALISCIFSMRDDPDNQYRRRSVVFDVLRAESSRQLTMLRIDKFSDGQVTTLRLSGRIQSKHLRELQFQIEGFTQKTMLDLEEVKLVDRATVQFLSQCESNGLDLLNCPLYVREWILRERNRELG
jgi:ABC-type transporter Mla MlaB component